MSTKVEEANEEELLKLFAPPSAGELVWRVGGWTIGPCEHGCHFAVTPPVVPQTEQRSKR